MKSAKERKAGSLGYAEAILIAYNKKMRSPLKWSKLYMSKSKTLDYDIDDIEYDDNNLETSVNTSTER